MDARREEEIWGFLAPKPAEGPKSLDEVMLQAVAEHLKFHTNDGMSLFVWATLSVTGTRFHIYPISTTDAGTALEIAKALHEQRGLPESGVWQLVFTYGDDERRPPVIQ